jgi:primosomal protein N' (replication factor Y) (superfamily II helicase)
LTKILKTILDQYQLDTKSGLMVSIDVNPFILM